MMAGSWVTDDSGTRWVEYAEKKPRKSARALRFANLQVGAHLMQTRVERSWRTAIDDMTKPPIERSRSTNYFVVTDLWFDPVAGQHNSENGNMVAVAEVYGLKDDKPVLLPKRRHTRRGLASNGFNFADVDPIELMRAKLAAENVVGIGRGRIIRQRPKMPGGRL